MPGLIGKKIGMTSVFSAEGKNVPCTVIEAGPCVVTQVKTAETDGYAAVQLAFDEKREKSTTKPQQGHFQKAGTTPKAKLVEFKDFENEFKLGDVVSVDIIEEDTFVDVRSEEHTSELQSRPHLVCRLLLEKKNRVSK